MSRDRLLAAILTILALTGLVVVLILSTGCASVSLGRSQSLAVGATLLDLGSTQLALTQCRQAREGNPMLSQSRNITAWAAVANAVLLGVFWWWSQSQDSTTQAQGWQAIGIVHGLAATNNVYQWQRCQ